MLRGKLEQHKLPGVEIFTGSGDRGAYNPKLLVKAWRMTSIPSSHPRNEETGDLIFEVLAVGVDGITPKLHRTTGKPYLTKIEMPETQALAYNLPPTKVGEPDIPKTDERFDYELPLKLADDEYLDLPRLGDGFGAMIAVRKRGAPDPVAPHATVSVDLTPVLQSVAELRTAMEEKLAFLTAVIAAKS